MKLTPLNAPDAPSTPGTYAQAMSVNDACEWLFISGQIPADASGAVPESALAQAHQIWANIDSQLRAAGMSKDNLVKVTIYLSDRAHTSAYREARDAYLDGRQVSLTCVIAGIFDSGWAMEIEAIAAR
ncbi:MAG: RidA family protein [Rhodobacteraceae bacterium]|nr:RidA family protein [Paracoccaceae bacterium]